VGPEPLATRVDEIAMRKAVPNFVPTLADTMRSAVDGMEERCRAETRKLYEDEGKGATLGPEGVPEALQEWLTKSRSNMLGEDGYRDKSRRRLRSQVERLESLLAKAPVPPNPAVLGAGAAMIEESSARALDSARAAIAAREKSFKSRLGVWEAAKAKHRAALRPQMGRPDASAALAQLCAAEAARCAEVVEAVGAVKRELVAGQAALAQAFVGRLVEQCGAALRLADSLVLTDDLGYLPGDELVEKKRKSLKRLKKLQRNKEAGRDGENEEDEPVPNAYVKPNGRHCPPRTWPPLPVKQLRVVFEARGVPVPEGAEVEGSEANWIEALAVEFGSDGPQGIVTTAHREIIRARDRNWDRFIQELDTNLARLEHHFGRLQVNEKRWEATWQGLVEALVRDNLEAEK